jgi:hypothetical protein
VICEMTSFMFKSLKNAFGFSQEKDDALSSRRTQAADAGIIISGQCVCNGKHRCGWTLLAIHGLGGRSHRAKHFARAREPSAHEFLSVR